MSMYIVSGRNNGLPCIPDVPDVTSMLLVEPVPEYVLRITADVNDGLPTASGVPIHTDLDISHLCFADAPIQEMFYGETEIRFAYCNGGTMFRKYNTGE